MALMAVSVSGLYAVDRYAHARELARERESAERDLDQALGLISQHPTLFGSHMTGGEGGDLKVIAQESASRRGVSIGYLSESDRETEKGRREHQVVIRLAGAPHPNLVLFLQELEKRGAGSRIKEIHVRPSHEVPDAYEEAEIVLTKTVASPSEKRP
jgi:hypothetical protein